MLAGRRGSGGPLSSPDMHATLNPDCITPLVLNLEHGAVEFAPALTELCR